MSPESKPYKGRECIVFISPPAPSIVLGALGHNRYTRNICWMRAES